MTNSEYKEAVKRFKEQQKYIKQQLEYRDSLNETERKIWDEKMRQYEESNNVVISIPEQIKQLNSQRHKPFSTKDYSALTIFCIAFIASIFLSIKFQYIAPLIFLGIPAFVLSALNIWTLISNKKENEKIDQQIEELKNRMEKQV